MLDQMRNGFYVEAGAYDGESLSNSLFFELHRNWSGLLVEPNPRAFRDLLAKDRAAYATGACLSIKRNRAQRTSFLAHGMLGGVAEQRGDNDISAKMSALAAKDARNPYVFVVNATCFPLDVMLDALSVYTVDFLSLDVEGSEGSVLETIDFSRFTIRLLCVEKGDTPRVRSVLEPLGYRIVKSGALDTFWQK